MSAWNPSDKAAGITLSSTNHIATSSSGNNSVRGVTSHNTGKWYIEFSGITFVGSGVIGLADNLQSLTSNSMSDVMGASDAVSVNSFGGGSHAFGPIHGHVLSLAVDLDANKFWRRIDAGNWDGDGLGTGDPVNGVHGDSMTGRPSALFAFAFLQNGGTCTINTGDSAFSESVPSGFTPWDQPAPPPVLRRPLVIF